MHCSKLKTLFPSHTGANNQIGKNFKITFKRVPTMHTSAEYLQRLESLLEVTWHPSRSLVYVDKERITTLPPYDLTMPILWFFMLMDSLSVIKISHLVSFKQHNS